MARNDPEVRLRLSPELKERITAAAKRAGRSLNAEVENRLEESFSKKSEMPDAWEVERSSMMNVIYTGEKLREANEQLVSAMELSMNILKQGIIEANTLIKNPNKIDKYVRDRWAILTAYVERSINRKSAQDKDGVRKLSQDIIEQFKKIEGME